MCQLREELIELLLALIQLTTTGIVDAEESHDAVDNEEAILLLTKTRQPCSAAPSDVRS